MKIIHPRPNPIVAALYTLRDMDIDVVLVHGPAGCSFMASRMLEEAGVRVITSGMRDDDLIFGGAEKLIDAIRTADERFSPKTIAVVGTCASMIIGEDMEAAVRRAGVKAKTFTVDCHGCMGDNTSGAVKAIESGCAAGIIPKDEADRQSMLMRAATDMEKKVGMAGREYLSPVRGPTKLKVARTIAKALKDGKKVAFAMIAKKELAYRFADMFLALNEAQKALGGELFTVGNLDPDKGLPRIRRYADDILAELKEKDACPDRIVGGLDEYAVIGEEVRKEVEAFGPDLLILAGIPHAYPGYSAEDVLITDQPRQLANYLSMGCGLAVGEISSHSMVMGARSIIPLETGNTLREVLEEFE